MTGSQTRSLADAKSHLSELVARVGSPHDRLTITVRGRPAAVLVAVADLEALEETIAVLADAAALDALAEADAELGRGERSGVPRDFPSRSHSRRMNSSSGEQHRRVTVVGVLDRPAAYRPQ